ncbi:HNH endonuclease [Actinomycetospora sp. NBRC 106378]|nr:HNH endonuclease [Actinomycetospora sp. NBRC 106378]
MDAVSEELTALLTRLGELAELPTDPAGDGATQIDRIAVLEQVRSAVAAAQHTAMVAFGRAQVEAQLEQIATGRLDPEKLGRGIADQIALAAHVSPHVADRRLNAAGALASDLPCTRALLAAGRISEWLAEQIVSLTSHLDPETRRLVDKQTAEAGLDELGRKAAVAAVNKLAYEADPIGFTARGRTARKDRRVTLRPAPDTMAVLSGLLPVEQGVACIAALRKYADSLIATGDTDDRTRDQIIADTLVERLTGQIYAEDVNVEVGIVLPLDALTDPDSPKTAELVGHGPLPSGIVSDLLRHTGGHRWWRRLFAHPAHGTLVGGDPRRRLFDGFLATLIALRDHGMCRDPLSACSLEFATSPAPPHRPHQRPQSRRADQQKGEHADRGRGTCVRGNHLKEMPGWITLLLHDGLGDQPHTVQTTTPTGHTYTSRAGP